jgi:hypothetical protein
MKMMIHKDKIDNYEGSMEQLAESIGDLKYDALSCFLELLATKIQKDGDKDKSRGRVKLAKHLHSSVDNLKECSKSINEAWIICEPYMK